MEMAPNSAPTGASLSLVRRLGSSLFGGRRAPDSSQMQTFDNPVRDKLREAGVQYSETEILQMERKFAEVKDRLLGAAVAMGRDGKIRLEFDPNEKTMSISLEKPRTIFIGADFLMKQGIEDQLTNAQHEGSHASLSRVGTGFFFQNERYRALLNVMEDLRVDAGAMDRSPGRVDEYLDFLYRFYVQSCEGITEDQMPKLYPHESYLQAVLYRAYGRGKENPYVRDPMVREALEATWPVSERAKAVRPSEDDPDEPTVQRYVAEFENILKNEILPHYEALYRESLKSMEQQLAQEAANQAGQEGQGSSSSGSSGRGGGSQTTIDPKDLSEQAKKILEGRAKKIADDHAPKVHGQDPQERAREIYGRNDETGQDKPEEKASSGEAEKAQPGTVGEHIQQARGDQARHNQSLAGRNYAKHLAALKELPRRVFQVFDQLLKPNSDFEYEGYFYSGPKIDIRRALKAIEGLQKNLKVFQRKVEPSEKDYRFSLLLDASGSMADGAEREQGGLGMAALFVDVFERLNLPYSLDAFHDDYIALKGFDKKLKTVAQRDNLFNYFVTNMWGGGGTNIRDGIRGSLKRILEEKKRDPRDVEFLFVLTDGEETHQDGANIRTLCDEAARRGVIVVGIGIGEGMQTVRQNFPIYLTENDPRRLPNLLSEFIKGYVTQQAEED